MKAIHLTAIGSPQDTLQLVEIPNPTSPGAQEVIIRVEYSPLNPSDLMVARGIYFIQPELPAVIGGEGVGIIEEIGPDVENVKIGDRVIIPFGTYAWAELVKAPANGLFPVADSADPKQIAMAGINPPTAILLLNEFTALEKGDWIVLNAGNSSVANTIIAVAKSRGIKTLAIVRRPDAVEIAKRAGAHAVLVENSNTVTEAKKLTGNANIRLGLDAIGGESSAVMAQILGMDSHLVTYAVLSGKPAIISQVDLIVKRLKVQGFWMYLDEYLPKLPSALVESESLISSNLIVVPIASSYPLSSIREAVIATEKGNKVLLDFTS